MASEGFCFWSFLRFTGKFLGGAVGFATVTIAATVCVGATDRGARHPLRFSERASTCCTAYRRNATVRRIIENISPVSLVCPFLSVSACSVPFMSTRQRIPEDLAEMTPGPDLAAVLAGLDLARLGGYDCVEVLKAQYRQLNHDRARLMTVMVEVGLADIDPGDEPRRLSAPTEFSADEVRAALVLTRRAADAQFWTAYDLCIRLPQVHAAMGAGGCDEPRARIFSEWTTDLSAEQARVVCARLLPRVGELTTGQLIDQIKKLAIALDPDWARRRYEQALADRKVIGHRNPDGTANLSGLNLPVERVAAASARIDALAKAAKHAGSPRLIDHLRAELFLGMTDGTYTGMDDTTILALLLATGDDSGDDTDVSAAGADGDFSEPTECVPETSAEPANDSTTADSGVGDPDADEASEEGTPRAALSGQARGGIELRVRVSTLLGRDQYPAEIAGWGPVHAELARDLISTLLRGQWRYAITDARGQLLHAGITRARPTGRSGAAVGRTRDVVELQIPAALLDELAQDTGVGRWAPVIADLAHHHREHDHAAGHERFAGDADRRHPGAVLRRHLQIRDRACV
ncbi:MAG: 13E12 repeat family protein, partial [Actinobacteria bacterium]|nr:13E12 repeat family protein [Actinomycetota bacterium]